MVTTRRSATPGAAQQPSEPAVQPTHHHPARSPRNSPFLPTPTESLTLAIFPLILLFGTVFSVLSPTTRSAPYDPITQSHPQDPSIAPSYFARKSNVFNVFFVKQGWGWTTLGFFLFLMTHPSGGDTTPTRRLRAALRWVAVTAWWFVVTQWCFGAPLIDRGFRWTGGACDLAERQVSTGSGDVGDVLTAVACKTAGGHWKGGHDISGHVFLLVLSAAFLFQELGWSVGRSRSRTHEERSVVMSDGAVKSARVEADTRSEQHVEETYALGMGGKTALAIAGLDLWMLLMTAIYFHTWFEKLTGLLTALTGIYAVYVLPRFVPVVRSIIGLPGI